MKSNSFKHHVRILLMTLTLFSVLFYLWHSAATRYHTYLMSNERAHTFSGASYYGNNLATAINSRFALLEGLKAFVQAEIDAPERLMQKEFDTFAAGLFAGTSGIRNFGIAPDGIMRYLFPLEGNEKAMGHNLVQHERPEVREDVQRTVRTGKVALSGPYELLQGGLGLVARSAVYYDWKFWGLVTMVIDMEPLLSAAKLNGASNLKLALRKQSGEVIYGSPDLFESDPVLYRVDLPEGIWEVAAIPSSGWGASIKTDYLLFNTSGITIISLLTAIFYLLFEQSRHLSTAVKNRTEQLKNEVDERKRIAEELNRSTESLREKEHLLSESQRLAHIGSWDYEIATQVIRWTDETYRIYGVSPDSFVLSMKSFFGLVHSDDIAAMQTWLSDCISGKMPSDLKFRAVRPDGSIRVLIGRGELLYDNNNKPYCAVGTVQDITGIHKLEEQLLHALKMEAVGQLAGGIAHDFNNILSAIIGYAHLIKMKMKEGDPLSGHINQVLASSERAAKLVSSLLAFSRKQIIQVRPMDLNEAVRRIEQLLHRIIGEDIEIKTVLPEEKIIITADSGQIEQVIINLATNARDAMQGSGLLTIEAGVTDLTESFREMHGFGKPGKYALLKVSDTGTGLDEATRARIFDPFFTTKEVGKGTGLGLSMAYGTVKQHEGYIVCNSEPGKGAEFRMYLPLCRQTDEEAPQIAAASTDGKGGKETVLVAEDDEDVRNLTRKILEGSGYKVVEAKDGEDAVNKFIENFSDIKLLLFDIIMPQKTGAEAYKEIRLMRHDIKALFLSGYTSDAIKERGVFNGELEALFKPVSPEELLRKVRDILDRQ